MVFYSFFTGPENLKIETYSYSLSAKDRFAHAINITWNPPPSVNFTLYEVEFGMMQNALKHELFTQKVDIAKSELTFPDLLPDTKYYVMFRVLKDQLVFTDELGDTNYSYVSDKYFITTGSGVKTSDTPVYLIVFSVVAVLLALFTVCRWNQFSSPEDEKDPTGKTEIPTLVEKEAIPMELQERITPLEAQEQLSPSEEAQVVIPIIIPEAEEEEQSTERSTERSESVSSASSSKSKKKKSKRKSKRESRKG